MASTSSNSRLLAIGAAVLVVGVILVLVIVRSGDDDASDPAPAATDQPTDEPSEDDAPLTAEQLSTARMALPLDVPEGMEAFSTTVNFVRGVAGVPTAGDRVKLYRLPQAVIVELDEAGQIVPQQAQPGSQLPPVPPAAETVLDEAEVLGVTGAVPNANGGTITLVLAVQPDVVPSLMALSNEAEVPEGVTDSTGEQVSDHANELWFTLLPEVEDAASEDAA